MSAYLKKVRGLTLVELMVVMAILAILSAIAYPLYTQQTQNARRADAKAGLELVALAQERYYTANGEYVINDMTSLSINGSSLSASSERGYYNMTLSGAGNGQSFTATATATGQQSSDSGCTTFTINQIGTKDSTGSSSDCW